MCNTCKGEGSITISNHYYATIHPCPDSHCDYDRAAAIEESEQMIKEMRRKLKEVAG